MTFKHIKFEDSVVMRSLEKLAKEKGLVTVETITKSASVKIDLQPSNNLLENILKLSSGLKKIGLEKYSEELESKLIAFKKASLYGVSDETGEDLIDAAHPKGSHKLEDVDSKNAVFQTIIDKHLSMVDMVGKKPTGKLSSAKDILKAVKTIFAQEVSSAELEEQVKDNLKQALKLFNDIDSIVKDRGGLSYLPGGRAFGYRQVASYIKNQFNEYPMTLDIIKDIAKKIKNVKSYISPGVTGGVSEDAWDTIEPLFDSFDLYFNKAIEIRHKINNIERGTLGNGRTSSTEVLDQGGKEIYYSIDNNIKSLLDFKPLINASTRLTPAQKATEITWIDAQVKELQDIKAAGPISESITSLSKLFGPGGDVTQYIKDRSWLKTQG